MGNSISDWVAITKNEKAGWSRFYREFTGHPLSDFPRLSKLIEDFGHEIVFESILACSGRKLTGDPLNYVTAIVMSKVEDEVKELFTDNVYRMRIAQAKDLSEQFADDLSDKIERARKVANATTNG